MHGAIDKIIHLSPDHAERLTWLAKERDLSEGALIEKALDLLFNLAEETGPQEERRAWMVLGMNWMWGSTSSSGDIRERPISSATISGGRAIYH